MDKIPAVAIVGRTNVGKSSLFNRLAGRRLAVVEDQPGVTRDRNYALITREGVRYTLIDTGGLIGEDEGEMQQAVRAQAQVAIAEADLIIAIFDGLYGVHPLDRVVVDLLRRAGKKTIWVVNKCEKPASQLDAAEFYSLGIQNPLTISAAHKLGIRELSEKIVAELDLTATNEELQPLPREDFIDVAIIGRPNVGKSTFVNRILGSDRVVTSAVPGTTTDSIDIELTRDGQKYRIVDTAGLRKKARVQDTTVERYGNLRTLRALARCDVAVLVLDATLGVPEEQDSKIAGLIHERGRGFVVVVNKWDAIEKDNQSVKDFERVIKSEFKFAPYAPIVFVSALTGKRCPSVLQAVKEVYQAAQQRIPTSQVNDVLSKAFRSKPPPVYRNNSLKLYFATQIETAPPTFTLFVNYPKQINFAYERYLKNALRKEFGFEGSDIKLIFRKRGAEEAHE